MPAFPSKRLDGNMSYKIYATNLAIQDLESIINYISAELYNPTAASSFLDAVYKCYDNLEQMPLMFKQCNSPKLRDMGYRRAVIKNYVMVYRVEETERTVYILRFFYVAQEYEKLI